MCSMVDGSTDRASDNDRGQDYRMSQATNATAAQEITKRLVQDAEERLRLLPKVFGVKYMIKAESMIYQWMGVLCREYTGGYWDFYELSNGGFYMAPAAREVFKISVQGNGFTGEMSNDTAGLLATLNAVCHLANSTGKDEFVDLYYLIRDYASLRTDWMQIRRAID